MIALLILEEKIAHLNKQIKSLFWSIDICGLEVKEEILKESDKSIRTFYIIFTMNVIGALSMFPFWKDQKEFYVCAQVYKNYFGKWSIVSFTIYILTGAWMGFNGLRLPIMLMYAIIQVRIQIYLINKKISHISKIDIKNEQFQQRIYKNLISCICHHIKLKKYVKKYFFVY